MYKKWRLVDIYQLNATPKGFVSLKNLLTRLLAKCTVIDESWQARNAQSLGTRCPSRENTMPTPWEHDAQSMGTTVIK